MRHQPADGLDALHQRIIRRRHGRHRAGLRHAVANRQLGQVEDAVQLAHQLGGDGAAGGDAGAELVEAGRRHGARREQLELGQEHGGHAVQRRGAVLLDGAQRGFGVEGLGGEDDGGAVRGGGHVAEDAAEAAGRRGVREVLVWTWGEGVAYWKRGGGQQTTSSGVSSILSPMLLPLFRIDLCVRQAALGMDVVPDVNWMFTTSFGWSPWSDNDLSASAPFAATS